MLGLVRWWWVRVVAVAAGLGCGREEAPRPGRVEWEVRAVGELGATMRLPAAARVEAVDASRVRVSVPGLPTLDVSRQPDDGPAMRSATTDQKKVTFTRSNGVQQWTCAVGDVPPGTVTEIRALCETLTPAGEPRIADVRCEATGGFTRAALEAMMRAQDEALLACFRTALEADARLDTGKFSVRADIAAGQTRRASGGFFGPPGSAPGPACFNEVHEAIKRAAAYRPEGGTGSFRCTTTMMRY